MTSENEQEIKRLKKELSDAEYDHRKEIESWKYSLFGIVGLLLLAIIFSSMG
jgi:hypothetical protein